MLPGSMMIELDDANSPVTASCKDTGVDGQSYHRCEDGVCRP